LLKRSGGKVLTGLKFAVAAISLLVAGATWRWGTTPKPPELPRVEEVRAQTSPDLAASRAAEPAPKPTEPAAEPLASSSTPPGPSSEEPMPGGIAAAAGPGRKRQPARPHRGTPRLRKPRPVAPPPSTVEPVKAEEGFDFGIDEPTPVRVSERVLPTTID
jgi:hypothetical protein